MTDPHCPKEEELLPLVTGETVAETVQGHLVTCSDCRGRLDRLRGDLTELRSTPLASVVRRGPARPAVIGKYLIVGELDSGGQSVVYRALHPTLDKELVIKLGKEPVVAGSADRDLLVREGKILAGLDHPNLARVYDLDFQGDLPFVVMEYVRGRTLADYAHAVKPKPREAAGLLAPVARALGLVHRRGIIHQDIKPRNILVDDEDRPKLIDFGMARLRHGWDGGDEPFGGTPAFTSPEQARGDVGQVTARSDVFALGGVLYYLLTGRAPFEARTMNDSLAKAARCDYDSAALESVKPRRLRAACLRAMAPNPGDRFERVEDFGAALDQIAGANRTRRNVLIGAMGLTAAIAGLWVGHRYFERPPFQPDMHVEVFRGDKVLDLRQALPLDPASDSLRFTAHVPPGYAAAMFRFDSAGEFEKLDCSVDSTDREQTLHFPKRGQIVTLKANPQRRTEMVIAVAAPNGDDLADFVGWMRQAVAKDAEPVASLPPGYSVHFNHRETRTQSFDEMKPDPLIQAEERIERLRKQMREHAPVVLGVTYSY